MKHYKANTNKKKQPRVENHSIDLHTFYNKISVNTA